MKPRWSLTLRNARLFDGSGPARAADLRIGLGRVVEAGEVGALAPGERDADLGGRLLLPGLVNAHDHLDLATFPTIGRPPYANAHERAADLEAAAGDDGVRRALASPLVDRLWLGGLRNLICGAAAVFHHGAWHRSLARPDAPVRVLERYGFAHSVALTQHLRRSYRSSDRRIPWLVHAGEGRGDAPRGELLTLERENVLRHNTVLANATALGPDDAVRIAAAQACVVWCPEAERRLYGATAEIAALQGAGVRIGLGSDSPDSGARDLLSSLGAARRESGLADADLVSLATRGSAEVSRLVAGGFEPGAPADFLATADLAALLAGDRCAVSLVVVAGRARFGEPVLMQALDPAAGTLQIEGEERRLEAGLLARARSLLAGRGFEAEWLRTIVLGR
jgi:cytosine/adenosine deaminase-related metal-dependent hydrolase